MKRLLRLVDLSDVVALVGFMGICAGVALFSLPLAFVVGGSILLGLSLVRYLRGGKES